MRILIFIGVFLFAFAVTMIAVYVITGGTPDTLIISVFGVCGSECGAMAWIKNTKEKQQERKEFLEDRAHQEELEKQRGEREL